ncbi:AraC family transcriptional regulator [Embleya scabrispora]|uniref:AraC family transcriptional regulator n=1 Tax=Embleya scabrispora TaxID=159449 RepID=UPI001913D992|nr:AraC family transcriptional regulator [Embleya scabrispora]
MTASTQLRPAVPLHRLEVPAPSVLPFAVGSFDSIGPLSRADFPHRHTFYEIAIVTGGRGTHVLDLVPRSVSPPQLFFIAPGQVHFWHRMQDLTGWVVLFNDDFLFAHPEDRDTVRDLSGCARLRPTPEAAPGLLGVVAELRREYAEQGVGFIPVLQAYLHVLILRAARLAVWDGPDSRQDARRSDPGQPDPGPTAALAQRFARLLDGPPDPDPVERTVGAYADRLGVSVGHLNHAVKTATGRTPGRIIRQAQVVEAKRLLAGSDLTVRQVADRVGFADPAYFCRFFRRETGSTPGEYRREINAKHHESRALSIDARDRRA